MPHRSSYLLALPLLFTFGCDNTEPAPPDDTSTGDTELTDTSPEDTDVVDTTDDTGDGDTDPDTIDTDAGDDTGSAPDTLDDADAGEPFSWPAPPTPTIPTAGCGLDHAWAPMDRMGHLVEVDYQSALSMNAGVLRALVEANGADPSLVEQVRFGVDTYLIRYITQDRGVEVEATAWITLPRPDDVPLPDDGAPAVLWLHGTTGLNDSCGPTADGIEGAAPTMVLAAMGFAAVAPDYIGLNGFGEPSGMLHPYLVPEATAVASLDSLRAMQWLQAEDTDIAISTETVLWGGSEGGFAALWSDRYAAHYAPGFSIAGTIALVPPTNLWPIAVHGVEHFEDATFGLAIMLVAQADWYRAEAPLSEVLTDEAPMHLASSLEDALRAECRPHTMDPATSVEDIYSAAWISALTDGTDLAPWTCYLDQADLAASAIPREHDAPLLVQVAENDDLVVGEAIRGDVPRLCDAGYRLEYIECAGADHTSSLADTLPYQIGWALDRFNDVPLDEAISCDIGPPRDCATEL